MKLRCREWGSNFLQKYGLLQQERTSGWHERVIAPKMLKEFIFAIQCSILNLATEPAWGLWFSGQKRGRSHFLTLHKLHKVGFCRFHKWPISRLWNHQSGLLRNAEGRHLKADWHITCRAYAVSMPFPCHAVPLIHTCHTAPPAMLRQCRVLRESPRGNRKYPNC